MAKKVERIVITGGPCSGKTALIEELASRGHTVIPESARPIVSKRKDLSGLEQSELIYQIQRDVERRVVGRAFLDRSLIDGVQYIKFYGGITESMGFLEPPYRYDSVFVLDRLPFIPDGERTETTDAEAKAKHDFVIRGYLEWGYNLIHVPIFDAPLVSEAVSKRADFVLDVLDNGGLR